MKRYSLYLKNDPLKQALESLVALHQSDEALVLTYGDLAEPKRFAKTMLSRLQNLQIYQLFEEDAGEGSPLKDYVLIGINEKARMLCFTELKNEAYLKEHRSQFEAVSSFHLHWDNQKGFKVKWPSEIKQVTKEPGKPYG